MILTCTFSINEFMLFSSSIIFVIKSSNTFTDVEAAALWLKENKHGPEAYKIFNLENTMKNIEKAIKSGNHYYGMGWRRVNG